MSKRKKVTFQLYLSFILVLLLLVAYGLLFTYYRNTRVKTEKSYVMKLGDEYKIVMGLYSELADFIYFFHVNRPEIRKLFADGILSKSPAEKDHYRKLLHKRLIELYNRLMKNNFRQLHFHESDNRSYLRFHRPGKFGDDLTGVRLSVEYVNREKKPIVGFEEGRIFNGYRFVFPVSYKKQHVGSVEISISMGTIIDQLGKRFNQKTEFIIRKSLVQRKVFKSELSNYSPWFIDKTYLQDDAIHKKCALKNKITQDDIARISAALARNDKNKKPFCVEIYVGSKPTVMAFWPIINFEDKNVAYIISLFDGSDLRNLDIIFYYITFLMFLLFVLLILFSFYYRFSQNKIESLASLDSLTKIYVRRIIMEILQTDYDRYMRYHTPCSVIMCDIDHFKNINDTYGHSVGDKVLVEVVGIMTKYLRKADCIGRYGGEEFLILLPETNKKSAAAVAERLRQKIAEQEFLQVGNVTMSFGVVEIRPKIQSVEDLIKEADKKLYTAKHEGRNKVVS